MKGNSVFEKLKNDSWKIVKLVFFVEWKIWDIN